MPFIDAPNSVFKKRHNAYIPVIFGGSSLPKKKKKKKGQPHILFNPKCSTP